MPISRSPSRNVKPAPSSGTAQGRFFWPVILIGFVALLAVIVAVLPASMVSHFLPPSVHAEDFSGSLWHGSAGRISVDARDAGALEWRLHPAALLGIALALDLHWVKVGFVVDAVVNIDRRGLTAHAVKGGGPIEDLHDVGIASGWHGTADINLSELESDFTKPLAAVGDVHVANLTSAQIADGADLGGYVLHLAEGAVDADGNVTAQLKDTGGPVAVQTLIRYSTKERTGLLTGTLQERPGAPAALLSQLENVSQLRGRDAQGRVPVELEFSL